MQGHPVRHARLHPLVPGLGRVLGGGTISSLSSIKVRNQAGQEDTRGLEIMQNIMEKRSSDWEKVFTRDQLRRMALSTGGDLRDFFRLSRDCLIKAVVGTHSTLPLPEKILTDSENPLRREMLPLAEADMHWLRQIAETKKPVLKEIQFLPQFARFLDTHLVLSVGDTPEAIRDLSVALWWLGNVLPRTPGRRQRSGAEDSGVEPVAAETHVNSYSDSDRRVGELRSSAADNLLDELLLIRSDFGRLLMYIGEPHVLAIRKLLALAAEFVALEERA